MATVGVGAAAAVADVLREFLARGPASGNEPSAGVEGLLARPLLVVTTVVVVAIGAGVFATSPFWASDSAGFALLSFLPFPPVLLALATGSTGSSLAGSVLIGTVDSFVDFVSADFVPFCVITGSGTFVVMPFGLFEADDAGLCRLGSAVDCIEVPLALDDEGRGTVGGGTGELRPTLLGSTWFGWTGVDAIEGDRAVAAAVLLGLVSNNAN